jgi:hypothetical protein
MDAHVERAWLRPAARMVQVFRADLRNARMLADPWSRAVHCMVNGWRIRLCHPPSGTRHGARWRPTWEVFVALAVKDVGMTARREMHDPWRRWASFRTTAPRRYIPKRKRATPVLLCRPPE